jgi:hypothetical protein
MIYRILIDAAEWGWDERSGRFRFKCRLRGASSGLNEFMLALGLPWPSLTNPRARFYFTEKGWREVGRHVQAEARRRGHIVKVIRRKPPLPSQIVYADAWQLALLPARSGQRRSTRE